MYDHKICWTKNFVWFIPDSKWNTFTFIFSTLFGTQNRACGSQIVLQLPLHLLTLFRIDLSRTAHRWDWPKRPTFLKSITHIAHWWNLPHLCNTLKRSKKHKNHVTHSLSSAEISNFLPEISNFCYVKKWGFLLHVNT